MEIRYLSNDPHETATLAKWIYEEWGHMVPGRSLETAKVKVLQTVGRAEIPLTLMYYHGGALAGTASIDTEDMVTHPEFTPWMASVFVDPAYRRRGIATALAARIKDELKRLGIKRAYLFTPDQERLYARAGWKTILREEYRGEQVVIMRLDLE